MGLGASVSGPFSCAFLWAGSILPAVLRTFGLGGEGVTDHPRHQLSHHRHLTELRFSFWLPPSGGMPPIDHSGMPHGHLRQEAQRALWDALPLALWRGVRGEAPSFCIQPPDGAALDFSGDKAYTLSWNSLADASMAISEFILLNGSQRFSILPLDLPCNPLGNCGWLPHKEVRARRLLLTGHCHFGRLSAAHSSQPPATT